MEKNIVGKEDVSFHTNLTFLRRETVISCALQATRFLCCVNN